MESIDDKSKVAIFVKHAKNINLKASIQKNYVLLVKNALRKVKFSW